MEGVDLVKFPILRYSIHRGWLDDPGIKARSQETVVAGGTLRIPAGKILGTLGKIRGITTPPLKNPINTQVHHLP